MLAEQETNRFSSRTREVIVFWFVVGIILLLLEGAALWRTNRLIENPEDRHELLVSLILLQVAASIFYFFAVKLLLPRSRGILIFVWIVFVGILLRVGFIVTNRTLASDLHRYLWDGAVVAHTINPYAYAPEEIQRGYTKDNQPIPDELRELAEESGDRITRINHPHLRTIYPPVAQGLFCMAYWISPFESIGWRLVLLVLDGLAVVGVCVIVRRLGKSPLYLAVYFWNPLLIYETYFNCHLDLAVAALVVTFAAFLLMRHTILAAGALALAVGIKLWPILLLPFLVFGSHRRRSHLLAAVIVFGMLLVMWCVPYAVGLENPSSSGIATYAKTWTANTGVYGGIHWISHKLVNGFNLNLDPRIPARAAVFLLLIMVSIVYARRSQSRDLQVCDSMALIGIFMLLLSPTVYPWYYVGLIGLLCVSARWVFLLWTLLLPISHLPEEVVSTQPWIPLLIHGPIWILLLAGWLMKIRNQSGKLLPNHV